MKVNYTTKNGRLSFEFDADSHVNVWEQLASLQEVFEEEKCLKCDGTNLRFSVRQSTYEDDKGRIQDCAYYELRCRNCGAKLSFGVMNDKSYRLFPKRKDQEGNWLGTKTDKNGNQRPTYGWVKWNVDSGKEE